MDFEANKAQTLKELKQLKWRIKMCIRDIENAADEQELVKALSDNAIRIKERGMDAEGHKEVG